MTKRLSTGVLWAAVVVMFMATSASAELPSPREWAPKNPGREFGDVPLVLRVAPGTTWVRVHDPNQSPCADADTLNSPDGQTIEHVWCFEGDDGDSTWPAANATSTPDWDHWSLFEPPGGPSVKWHLTEAHGGAIPRAGPPNYNAWCGCDSVGTNPNCDEVAFWIFKEGSGDDWNYTLTLDVSDTLNMGSGGVLQFDVRYDTECNYDYMYLEYEPVLGSDNWVAMVDTAGVEAKFNAVSGNTDGRDCGEDIYGHSDQRTLGGKPTTYHGNSQWVEDVTFPIPNLPSGFKCRWRGFSDVAWSDADGRGDTDGIGAIDNVTVTWNTGGSFSDNFDASGAIGPLSFGPRWTNGVLQTSGVDTWHLQFDPDYKNKGNTCTFSNDWMWAAKPAGSAIPASANGFRMYLVSPVIDTDGWTGGVVEYAEYRCVPAAREDYTNTHIRVYDATVGVGGSWGIWVDFDGFVIVDGCDAWATNASDGLTPHLGTNIDSIRVAWEILDASMDGEFTWGKHGQVTYQVDNVSFGSFDGSGTQFGARRIDLFTDTFSQSDPAHTSHMQNADHAKWIGLTAAPCAFGVRPLGQDDSLTVEIQDHEGITESNVLLWWRHNNGGAGAFGSWSSVPMHLSIPGATTTTDEGTYRGTFGRDDGGAEDMTAAGDCRIWLPGTTVEYYLKVSDNTGATTTLPTEIDPGASPPGAPFSWRVLPLNNTTPNGERILVVNDWAPPGSLIDVDFENSSGFSPTGGIGFGGFAPLGVVGTDEITLAENVLDTLYPPEAGAPGINNSDYQHHYDVYNMQGFATSVQCEPNGLANAAQGLGGYIDGAGDPIYDVLFWLHGRLNFFTYADTTRLELGTYLDAGGKLLSMGDGVVFELGDAGGNGDSTIQWIQTYLGVDLTALADEHTDNRVLNVGGVSPEFADVLYGIYGECPIRRDFARMTENTSPDVNSDFRPLMVFTDGGAGDEGRLAVVENRRSIGAVPKGVAVHASFGLSALVSRLTMTCFVQTILVSPFGMAQQYNGADCVLQKGVDAPEIANGFGFDLRQAAPNPFRSTTSISFSVANRTHVSIEVYNILGQKVRTLVDEAMEPNSYVRDWDGRSDRGERVSSGIYFYKMVAGEFSDTKKTVLLR